MTTFHKMSGLSWLIGYGDNASSTVDTAGYLFEHPHSIYLSTLFYGGIIGLGLLLALIAKSYVILFRAQAGEPRGIALACLTFGAVSLLFDGDYLLDKIDYVWLVLWLPVALTASLRTVRSDRDQ